ncbi:MAG: SGNH/GDSL hydrolase family protein [Planctomycetes bacterium]|nr:SGNH/GDSL hydrolase family protein [Planctomycetota bacterium]
MGLIIAVLIGEVALRVLNIHPERYPPPKWLTLYAGKWQEWGLWGNGFVKRPSRFQEQGVQMGEYVPGAQLKVVYSTNPRGYFDADGGIAMDVNSLGFRGPEVSPQKPAGTFRILGIGDSFTFGVGVREPDTFLRRLEKQLNNRKDLQHAEVLNVGVQGYNTRDEVLNLEGRWLSFSPDLVLINFYLNDAYDDSAFLNNGQALGIYDQPSRLARVSRIYDFWEHRQHNKEVTEKVRQYYLGHYFQDASEFLESPGQKRVDWTVCKLALARAAELAKEHHFKLALILWPELDEIDGKYPFEKIHTVVKDTCRSLGIPVLDLREAFKAYPPRDLWVHPTDHHPNEIAAKLAAEAIEKFIVSQGLLAN